MTASRVPDDSYGLIRVDSPYNIAPVCGCAFLLMKSVPISLLLGTKTAKTRVYNAENKPSFAKGKERGKNEAFWKALFHHLHER